MKKTNELKNLELTVVGHIEWVTFIEVENFADQGQIGHGEIYAEKTAGGGTLTAIALSKLTNKRVNFITALGRDYYGYKCHKELTKLGLNVHVAWRSTATRRGVSMLNKSGERSITVIGQRLSPIASDNLPWELASSSDGIFVSATDKPGLIKCRRCKTLVSTPRIGLELMKSSNVKFNAIIGSDNDAYERKILNSHLNADIVVKTRGESGGEFTRGRKYKVYEKINKPIDSYGCGDNFAAGVTAGLSANWEIDEAIKLGSQLGAECAKSLGPY